MPATPGRKKKTAAPPASTRKKKVAAPDESLQDLTNLMGQMNVAKPTENQGKEKSLDSVGLAR